MTLICTRTQSSAAICSNYGKGRKANFSDFGVQPTLQNVREEAASKAGRETWLPEFVSLQQEKRHRFISEVTVAHV